MTISEKYFRKYFKIKPDVKLTPSQHKIVRMMHECLKEYNKPKLPHGTILVKKEALVEHLKHVKECLSATDKLMLNPKYKEFSRGDGGGEMAKIWNALNLTLQSVMYFELKVPLERLQEDEILESI